MPAPDALLTYADLQTWTDEDVPEDRAEQLIDQATAIVREHCGWRIAGPVTETLAVSARESAGQLLALPTLHLTAVTEVRLNGTPVLIDEWDPTGQLWRWWGWVPRHRSYGSSLGFDQLDRWDSGQGHPFGRVEADVTHGHPTVPADVAAVICNIVTRAVLSPVGLNSESLVGQGTVYSQSASGQSGGVWLATADQLILDRHAIAHRP